MNAQTTRRYRIDTIAGMTPASEEIPATEAILDQPQAVGVDKAGTIYISVASGIRSITSDGNIHRTGMSPAISLAIDRDNVFYTTLGGPEYYRRDASGKVTAFRPTDGVINPEAITGLAVDSAGNLLIADQVAKRILRVTGAGAVTVVAGIGSRVPLNAAPNRVATDASNNIFVTSADRRILRITPAGEAQAVVGSGAFGAPVAGPAVGSPFRSVGPVVVTRGGVIYVADAVSGVIAKVDPAGKLEIAASSVATADLAVDPDDNLLVSEGTGSLWRLNPDGSHSLIAGRPQFAGDGGPAVSALMRLPKAVSVQPDGSLWVGDTGNNRIRKVSTDGLINTVAGNGQAGVGGDGTPPQSAQVAGPDFMALDADGNLYFASRGYPLVRRVTRDGHIETVAGTGTAGEPAEGGAAASERINNVSGLAVGSTGEVFISDSIVDRVRVVRRDGSIATYAGTGEAAAGGEGTSRTATPLNGPTLLAIDGAGNLAIFESRALRIRRVEGDRIATLATTVPFGKGDSGRCVFSALSGMAFDVDGSLLVSGNSVICRLDKEGNGRVIAGDRSSGFSGDGGSALSALLRVPAGLAVAPSGAIYFADSGNHRIRRLDPDAAISPLIADGGIVGAGGSIPAVTRLSPGGLATIFGTGFTSNSPVSVQASDLKNGVLPTTLAGTCVQVDSLRGYPTFVSSGQINFQVPDIKVNASISVQVIANCETTNETRSLPVAMETQRATPEFLYWMRNVDGRNPVVAVNSLTGAYIGASATIAGVNFTPAKPGDLLTLYCISLGPTSPTVPPGQAAGGAARVAGDPIVTIGGSRLTAADVLYVGASPGSAGLYQVNLKVPVVPDGDQIVSLKLGEFSTPVGGYISVKN